MAVAKKKSSKSKSQELTLIREPQNLLLSRKSLSVYEKRIYWLILKHVKSKQGFDLLNAKESGQMDLEEFIAPKSDLKFTFHYTEIMGANAHVSNQIKSIFDSTQSRRFIINDPKNPGKFEQVVIFPKAGYERATGMINIEVHRDAVPYFLELSKGFSQYYFDNALSLNSEYAQILFPILCNYRKIGRWKVSIEELKEKLELQDVSTYDRFSNFKQRVLDTALRQINECTEISVEMLTEKESRQIKYLIFKIQANLNNLDAAKKALQDQIDSVLSSSPETRLKRAVSILHEYYDLDQQEKQLIFQHEELLNSFLRADLYVEYGFAKTNPTAYIRQSVFNYKNQPAHK